MAIFDFIVEIGKTIISPITTLIDDLNTSDEEKLTLRNKLQEMNLRYQAKLIEYDSQLLKAQSNIITAEAKGDSWLQRNWRPITMITFLILICLDSFGILANPLPPDAWTVLKIGLGGYIVGRSGEKIVKTYKEYKNNGT